MKLTDKLLLLILIWLLLIACELAYICNYVGPKN